VPIRKTVLIVVLGLAIILASAGCGRAQSRLDTIQLPPGFAISLYADGLEGARSLALGPGGVVFVGSRATGRVWALSDENGDGVAEAALAIAAGLDAPNGVAYRDGALYVAENSRILRYDDILANLRTPPAPVVVNDTFPRERHHGWKFIAFGPDGKLYVPVGAPCNICASADPRFASIMRMNPDGSGLEIFARGVRNTVGFDWHPATGELWFTDNGRDWLGDDQPPDELNHAPRPGLHFGYPHNYGDNRPDPEFKEHPDPAAFTPPAQKLGAHVAPLGMRFYTGTLFPAEYRGHIFVAEHGSWNRSAPTGYRITLVRLQDGRPAAYEVFAQGWLQGVEAWGRPVDLLVMPDGALLVSDDKAGAIYRITYR
jgi:glucose/arabinose dehydrogenase